MKFTIAQIIITDAQYYEINKNGWSSLDIPGMENFKAKQSLSFSAQAYNQSMKEFFTTVATVEVDSIYHVFSAAQAPFHDSVELVADSMTSLSVGDMITDENGKSYIVDCAGFLEI